MRKNLLRAEKVQKRALANLRVLMNHSKLIANKVLKIVLPINLKTQVR